MNSKLIVIVKTALMAGFAAVLHVLVENTAQLITLIPPKYSGLLGGFVAVSGMVAAALHMQPPSGTIGGNGNSGGASGSTLAGLAVLALLSGVLCGAVSHSRFVSDGAPGATRAASFAAPTSHHFPRLQLAADADDDADRMLLALQCGEGR